jgi:D-arabinose 1-dehydrogenase-like Zn-dependent alcohol dehydrogenase
MNISIKWPRSSTSSKIPHCTAPGGKGRADGSSCHSGALPSDLVAIQGIGGLGHLAIQFATKFGYRVAALSRGADNAALAKKLGADIYIDSAATDVSTELQKLGGARVILATSPSGKSMSTLVGGLGANGTLLVVGASTEPIEVPSVHYGEEADPGVGVRDPDRL